MNPRREKSIAAFMAALPGAQNDIRAKSGLGKDTVMRLVKALHGIEIRIFAWRRHPKKGPAIPVYTRGGGLDMPNMIKTLTRREVYERYERRIKDTPVADQRRARHRELYWQKKAKLNKNTWASALFIR